MKSAVDSGGDCWPFLPVVQLLVHTCFWHINYISCSKWRKQIKNMKWCARISAYAVLYWPRDISAKSSSFWLEPNHWCHNYQPCWPTWPRVKNWQDKLINHGCGWHECNMGRYGRELGPLREDNRFGWKLVCCFEHDFFELEWGYS